MRNERFRFLMSSLAAVCLGVATLSGCGDSGPVQEIQNEESPTESMKDSMEYMREQRAKQGGSRRGR